MQTDTEKIAVIGCGTVGCSTAFALMSGGLFSRIALVDEDRRKAELEALDMTDGPSFETHVEVEASDYDGIMDSHIIVIAEDSAMENGEEDSESISRSVERIKNISWEIGRRDYQGIILVVAEPVELLSLTAYMYSGLDENRVIGIGTVLDTARLKMELGEQLDVDSSKVHAFIIGEKSDGEMVAWSAAHVSGKPLSNYFEMRSENEKSSSEMRNEVRNCASAIINEKRHTLNGVAMSAAKICRSIVLNEKTVLPVSSLMKGEYGVDGISLSVPAVVGSAGVECHVPIFLNRKELGRLQQSAASIRKTAALEGIIK